MTTTTDDGPAVDPAEVVPLETACEWRDRRRRRQLRLRPRRRPPRRARRRPRPRRGRSDDVLDITREAFPLPTLGPELAAIADDLVNGRGMVLLRGVPVERYGKDARLGHLLGRRHAPRPPLAPERQGPPARRRHRPGPGRRRPHRPRATRSAASRSRSTPTGPTWSACSASTPGPAAATAWWPTPSPSTTTSSAPSPSWPPSSTGRSPTTCAANRPADRRADGLRARRRRRGPTARA